MTATEPVPIRRFKVTSVHTKNSKKGRSNNMVVKAATPGRAASKAANKICRESDIHGQCALDIHLKETTRGSNEKSYAYHVRREKVNKSVNHDGVRVLYKYSTVVRAL